MIKFNANDLLPTLKLAIKAISKSSSLPILDSFMISGNAFGGCLVTASDLENTISLACPIQVDVPGFCVNAQLFLKVIDGNAGKDISIDVDHEHSKMSIKTGSGKFTMPIEDATDFPTAPVVNEKSVAFDGAAFSDTVNRAAKFVVNDELRPIMNGVYIGKDYVTATDAHFLYKTEPSFGLSHDVVISSRSIGIVTAWLAAVQNEELYMATDGRNIKFSQGDSFITARLIEGQYPNVLSVIPSGGDKQFSVKKDLLLSAIKRVSVFSNKISMLIKLSFVKDSLTVSSQNLDFSTAAEEIVPDAICVGDLDIGFNSQKLLQCLSAVSGDSVGFVATSPDKAVLIVGDNEDTILLMPMMIN